VEGWVARIKTRRIRDGKYGGGGSLKKTLASAFQDISHAIKQIGVKNFCT